MEWLAGAVAGAVTGVLGALLTPWTQHRVAEAKERSAARRALIRNGRALVIQAFRDGWEPHEVAEDVRYLELRRHLRRETRARFEAELRVPGRESATDAIDERTLLGMQLDGLEAEWKLS